MALNQHLAQGGELKGVWQQADEKIKEAMDLARRYQNSDGVFPVAILPVQVFLPSWPIRWERRDTFWNFWPFR